MADRWAVGRTRAIPGEGAHGYVRKSDLDGQLAEVVEAVHQGSFFFSSGVSQIFQDIESTDQEKQSSEIHPGALTRRQLQVLPLLAQGMTNQEIAETPGISIRTVEAYPHEIMGRLQLPSLSELVRYAVRHHLINADGNLFRS